MLLQNLPWLEEVICFESRVCEDRMNCRKLRRFLVPVIRLLIILFITISRGKHDKLGFYFCRNLIFPFQVLIILPHPYHIKISYSHSVTNSKERNTCEANSYVIRQISSNSKVKLNCSQTWPSDSVLIQTSPLPIHISHMLTINGLQQNPRQTDSHRDIGSLLCNTLSLHFPQMSHLDQSLVSWIKSTPLNGVSLRYSARLLRKKSHFWRR